MLGLKITTQDTTANVTKAVDKAAFRNFGNAAASIRKDEISSIEKSEKASEPGTPPHTRKGQLKKAIQYAYDKDSAVIGPVASMVGQSASIDELGGEYKGEQYPARPFAGPALERATPRFAGSWSGSVGG